MADVALDTLQRLNAAAPGPLAERARKARLVGERKPVTAVFADIVGSTTIAETIDPEDWTEIINGAFEEMSRSIFEYEGTIAQLQGDAMICFFGAPVAHEDDPERAVRASLSMLDAVDRYGAEMKRMHGIDFQIRVGISTGLVLVGEVGSDLRYDYTAVGDTMNLASRLQGQAEPGGILIGESTERFTRPFFELEDVGPLELKGKAEPVHGYRVIGPRAEPLPTRGISGLTSPMVGRAAELDALRAAADVARAGRGRVAVLIGEPGLGKSRLLTELKSKISEVSDAADAVRETAWVTAHASSYGRQMPFHLITNLLRDLIGVGPANSPAEVDLALKRALKELMPDDAEAYDYLAYLLGIPLGQTATEVERVGGELLEERMSGAVLRLVRAAASQGPLVIAVEDLHWADSASAEVLQGLLVVADDRPVLIVCTSREEPDAAGWAVIVQARERIGSALTEIRLAPLQRDSSRELVSNLLEIESLSTRTRDLILDKAEGNPFFAEEVIRMLIEREAIERRDDRWVATGVVDDIEIPDTLHGLILARLDRLPDEARRVLRLASCIDRRFAVALLEDVARAAGVEEPIGSALARLEGSDLLLLAGTDPEVEYRFRHALVQDAAYETVLRNERRAWHGLVAEAILARYPDREEEFADQLARHYTESRQADRAVHYLLLTGQRALARAASADARIAFGRAATLLPDLPEPGAVEATRARLAVALGQVATEIVYLTVEEGFALVAEGQSLAEQLGDRSALVNLLYWEQLLRRAQGETVETSARMAALEERIAGLGDATGDDVHRSILLFQTGLMQWFSGDFEPSKSALDEAARLMLARGDVVGAAMAEGYIAANHATAGAFDEADRRMAASRDLAERADELSRLDYRLAESAIAGLRGDFSKSVAFATDCFQAATEMGALGCATVSGMVLGLSQLSLGEGRLAKETLERSLELATQGYLAPMRQRVSLYIASANGMTGDLAAAEEGFTAALATYAQSDSPYGQAEAQLMRGLVQASHPEGDPATALEELDTAIAVFEAVGARPNLARALRARAMALAKLERVDEADVALGRAALLAREMDLKDAPWPASVAEFRAMQSAEPPIQPA